MADSERAPAPAHPAATVVLLRDGAQGLEVLLLRRNTELSYHGGAWVFPGGRIDNGDYPTGAPGDDFAAAANAAVREVREEAGLDIDVEALLPIAHWTTPEDLPKRFSTWFYSAKAGDDPVVVDGKEILDHRWTAPAAALAEQRKGRIELPPPTFVTLTKLTAHATARAALEHFARAQPERYFPRVRKVDGGRCSLYREDEGYCTRDLNAPGRRHRLWMLESGWRYEREL